MTDDEWRALQEAAAAAGVTASDFIRDASLRAARRRTGSAKRR
jgi:uncharacterized protein (DUF1778 family)